MAESTVVPVAATQSVIVIEGVAYVRNATGGLVQLKPGDPLLDGQTLITDAQGFAKLQLPNGEIIDIGPNREVRFDTEMASMPPLDQSEASVASAGTVSDQILGALEQGIDVTTALEPAAAGLVGGPGSADEGHGFVRLLRIVENVSPLAFNFEAASVAQPDLPPLSDPDIVAAEAPVNDAPDAVDDGPEALPDALTTPEDTALTIAPAIILANDTDPENDTLTITSVQAPVNGTVQLVDGQIIFTPTPDYNGPASFTYTISDGNGGTDTATVNIDVTPVNDDPDAVNDGPDALPDALTTPEDTALTIAPAIILANDTDPENDTLTITSVQAPVNGTVQLVDGQIIFTPTPDYNGPASFTYTISDGNGGTDTATVNIDVTPVNDDPDAVNDGPDALPDALTTPEDTALTIAPAIILANDTDPENDTLTITSVQAPVNGTVQLVDGQIIFTPTPDYNGPASFTYTISDGNGGTDTATVNIDVTPVNDDPDAVNDGPDALPDALTTPEDTALTIAPAIILANDTDPENDTLTITSVQAPVNGTVQLVDGQIIFTPTPDYNGPASFTYTISDGNGGTDTATVNIDVTPVNDDPDAVNDGPDALPDALTTPEDTALTIAPAIILANDTDPENDTLTITSVQAPVNGTVQLVDGQIIFTPTPDYNGPASFTYTISDGNGGTDTATVSIDVTPVNDPPVATDNLNTIAEDTVPPVTGNMISDDNGFGVDSDVDAGAVLHVSAVTGGNAYGTLTWYSNGTYSYVLNNLDPDVQGLVR